MEFQSFKNPGGTEHVQTFCNRLLPCMRGTRLTELHLGYIQVYRVRTVFQRWDWALFHVFPYLLTKEHQCYVSSDSTSLNTNNTVYWVLIACFY